MLHKAPYETRLSLFTERGLRLPKADLETPLDDGEIEMLKPYSDLMVEVIQQLMVDIYYLRRGPRPL